MKQIWCLLIAKCIFQLFTLRRVTWFDLVVRSLLPLRNTVVSSQRRSEKYTFCTSYVKGQKEWKREVNDRMWKIKNKKNQTKINNKTDINPTSVTYFISWLWGDSIKSVPIKLLSSYCIWGLVGSNLPTDAYRHNSGFMRWYTVT